LVLKMFKIEKMKKIFLFELLFFLSVQILGILNSQKILKNLPEELKVSKADFSFLSFLAGFSILVLLILLVLKFKKTSKIFFGSVFILVIFFGLELFFEAWLPFFISLPLTILLLLSWRKAPFVWLHNLLLILALSGIGFIGLSLSPMVVLVLFLVFSFYDLMAVYLTGHMVKMAEGMLRTGAVLGILVPKEIPDFKKKMAEVKVAEGEKRFSLLGSGDIIFPLIFSVSFLPFGISPSLIMIVFSCLGLGFGFWLFKELKGKPMPALPPIYLFCLLGFFINLLIL